MKPGAEQREADDQTRPRGSDALPTAPGPSGPAAIGDASRRPPVAEPVACMRCGHDLRGEMLSWADAWPIDGRCPECGVAFAWRELLSRTFKLPDWCPEGGRGPFAFMMRSLRTWIWAAVWPLRIVHGLAMFHRVRAWALGLLLGQVAVVWCSVYLLVSLPVHEERWVESMWWSSWSFNELDEAPRPWLQFVASALTPWDSDERSFDVPIQPGSGGWLGTSVGVFDVDPGAVRDYASRHTDLRVFRTWQGFALAGDPAPQGAGAVDPGSNARLFLVPLTEALRTQPLAPTPTDAAGLTDTLQLGSPDFQFTEAIRIDRRNHLWTPVGVASPTDFAHAVWRRMSGVLLIVFVVAGGSVASFLLLPIARRRARVQWRHIGRLAVYGSLSATILAVVMLLFLRNRPIHEVLGAWADRSRVLRSLTRSLGLPQYDTWMVAGGIVALSVGVLVGVWWARAASCYLRMQRPWAVGAAVVAIPVVVIPMLLVIRAP